ncbi:DNA cytosine methyltransferase [Porphyromonas uenonis]|uniref:DNA cytosine methyltransferase n=1 Tax=Porphyromonas uenonis TaxID=281920 RepID=UPI0026F02F95|nr:DNA cytosine methyltransferase [Porphyromonas uenonis]
MRKIPAEIQALIEQREEGVEELAILSHYWHQHSADSSMPSLESASLCEVSEPLSDYQQLGSIPIVSSVLFKNFSEVPFPAPIDERFTFIDLFAGIGGFRIAAQSLGGRCVYSSEWDEQARKSYFINYGDYPFGDITLEKTKSYIPPTFDLLCAGFPCQSFSIAGHRKGFEEARGTLFFEIAEILRRHRPKAFFLENVKGLLNHDRGNTIKTILHILRDELHYVVPDPQIVSAQDFGIPQKRERVFILGFRSDQEGEKFAYPRPTGPQRSFGDVKEENEVSVKYYLSTQYIDTLRKHKARHQARGNGFGYEVIADDEVANTIVVGGMGRERNLVIDHRLQNFVPITHIVGEVNREGLRRMTPREWARLQGFPDQYIIGVSDSVAYKQFANSVAIPAVQATMREVLKCIQLDKESYGVERE